MECESNENMSIAHVLGADFMCSLPPFFPNCLHLKFLVVDGDFGKEISSFKCSHPGIHGLQHLGSNPFFLKIDCPELLELWSGEHDYEPAASPLSWAPTLSCPKLTNLHPSNRHTAEGVLQNIAEHAQGIHQLSTCIDERSPSSEL